MMISTLLILVLSVFSGCSESITTSLIEEEEVVFKNGELKLYGTLFIPSAENPLPSIVIAHGSGEEHRKLRGYRSIAQKFAEEGYVTLLWDKRGVGDSDGTYEETPVYEEAAGDLIAAIHLLKDRPEVQKDRIGLYGHSQAGWIMPIAASVCRDINFLIVSCGGGVIPRDQVIYNHYVLPFKKSGLDSVDLHEMIDYVTAYYTYLGTGEGYQAVYDHRKKVGKESWFQSLDKTYVYAEPPLPSRVKAKDFKFFRKILHRPLNILESLEIPVLLILAEKDEQVPSFQAKEAWEIAFTNSGNIEKLKIAWLEEEGHAIFEMKAGKPRMKPVFWNVIKAYLNENDI